MIVKKFESKFGFDANGETLSNLGDPVFDMDGVNKAFFEYNKSVIPYDTTRGYPLGFISLYDNTLYVSNKIINKPSGVFNNDDWNAIKSPPAWRRIAPSTTRVDLVSSDFIIVTTEMNPLDINLPRTPREGTSISIYDVGGIVGTNRLTVLSNRNNIKLERLASIDLFPTSFNITTPYSLTVITYINGSWDVKQVYDPITLEKNIPPSTTTYNAQAGEKIKLLSTDGGGTFTLNLPLYSSNGDTIEFSTSSKESSYLNVTIPQSASSTIDGLKNVQFNTYKDIRFVYNSTTNRWNSVKSVKDKSSAIILGSYIAKPNQDVIIQDTSTNVELISVTLPSKPSIDDRINISFSDVSKEKNIRIVGNGVKIKHYTNRLGSVLASTHYVNTLRSDDNVEFNPDASRLQGVELTFKGTEWIFSRYDQFVYFADSTKPESSGLVSLVNDADITVNVMTNKEVAITPAQLQKRVSTTSRSGIAPLATNDEVLAGTVTTKIVTPSALHNTKSSETQHGLLFIASQNEVDVGTNHTKAVTPLTLDSKRPNESGKFGVVTLVTTTEVVAGTNRTSAGVGIYNRNDAIKVVTPKSLHQLVSTETAIGVVYKATESEVLSGVADVISTPLFVSPFTLSRRTATEARTGIAKLTSKSTVLDANNHTDIVTPSTLHSVQATYDLKGLARFWNSDSITPLGADATGIVNVKSTSLDMRIVSQNSLNDLFKYYLPKTATAVNSDKVGMHGIDNIFLLDRVHSITPKQTFADLIGTKLTSTNGTITNLTSTKVSIGTSTIVHDDTLRIKNTTGTSDAPLQVSDIRTDVVTLTNSSTLKSLNDDTQLGFPDTSKGSALIVRKGSKDLLKTNQDSKVVSTIVDTENMKNTLGATFASLVDNNNFQNINTYTKVTRYDALSNRSNKGYMFHIFESGSSEITTNMSWLKLPPTNISSRSVVNGVIAYTTDGVPKYDADYIYERYQSSTHTHEKLMVLDKMYHRFTNLSTGNTNGWDLQYSMLNKPSPIEINAVDRDEVMTGKIQVRDYLDIIIDDENTFRIRPDKDTKKAIFAWLEKE